MVRAVAKILAADAVLLGSMFLVLQDLEWRTGYASSALHYAPSFDYSVLTRFLTMTGQSTSLVSPPTLDWVQLLMAVLAVLNLSYLYRSLRRSKPDANVGSPS